MAKKEKMTKQLNIAEIIFASLKCIKHVKKNGFSQKNIEFNMRF